MSQISFSGLASGIDGDAIIKTLIETRRLAGIPNENKIVQSDNENSALKEFNTKLLSFNDSLKDFRTLSGGGIVKQALVSDNNSLGVVVDSSSTLQSFSLSINQLAQSATIAFNQSFESKNSVLNDSIIGEESISFIIGQGEKAKTFSVAVTNETTLSALVDKVNLETKGSATASMINTGTAENPSYKLFIQSDEAGISKGAIEFSLSEGLQNGALNSATITQAKNAKIFINGIGEIERESNRISDVLPGITLDLKSVSNGSITTTIQNDTEKILGKLQEVIAKFNELIVYSSENSKIDRIQGDKGVTNEYGILARTRVDDQAISALRAAMSGASLSGELKEVLSFADLGVKTARDGTLELDPAAFNSAIAKEPNSVNEILKKFSDSVTSVNGVVYEYTKTTGIIQKNILSNEDQKRRSQETLDRMERSIEKQEMNLKKVFVNLERTISRLNSQSTALSSLFFPSE